MTGQQVQGITDWIRLRDGRMLQLEHNFPAMVAYEREFRIPWQAQMDDVAAKLSTAERDATNEEIYAYCERNGIPTRPGPLEEQARWAYALTESCRKESAIPLGWTEFFRLLPVGEALLPWTRAVAKVLNQQEDAPEKKSEAEIAPTDSQPSSTPADTSSTGDSSSTGAPSNGDAAEPTSGECPSLSLTP